MQVNTKRVGRIEAVGRKITVITPDGADPTNEYAPLAVSFGEEDVVTIRTNNKGDSSAVLKGIDAIQHVHNALGEMLRLREVPTE